MRLRRSVALVACVACWVSTLEPLNARRAGITLVGVVYSPAAANDNTITLPTNQAGDVVVVIAAISSNAQTLTISDDTGRTWINDCPTGAIDHSTSTAVRMVTGYATVSSPITTITLTSSSGSTTFGSAVVYRGMGTVSCDGSDTDETTTAQSHGGGISVAPTTTNYTLMFGATAFATGPTTVTVAPDTYSIVGTALSKFWSGYKVVTSTNTNNFALTTSGNVTSITVLMAIKSSVSLAPCGSGLLLGVGCWGSL